MTELAQIVAGWPAVVSMAAVAAAQGLRAGRRRSALNEALHEQRRPLQAVALAGGPGAAAGGGDHPLDLAAAALERLDREINGEPPLAPRGAIDARSLVQAAVWRWLGPARRAEATLELRWNAGAAIVEGDRCALAQALDNLIVNAVEHGGPTIVVSARRRRGRLRIAVADSGLAARPASRYGDPAVRGDGSAVALARLRSRGRRGHGLSVVRRVVAAHEGRFVLRRAATGSLAALEIPLLDDSEPAA